MLNKKISLDFQKSSNSGAKIFLIEDKDKNHVKKFVYKDLKRFKASVLKQKEFEHSKDIQAIDIEIHESKNNIEVIMPYIEGIVGSGYASNASIEDINNLSIHISNYFEKLIESANEKSIPTSIINSKINETLNNIKKNNFISSELLELSIAISNKLIINDRNIVIPTSECHGDFTFANIIFNTDQNKIFLIDFLDSFISSYLIDYAKLVQDILYCWSVRGSSKHIKLKHLIIGHKIFNEIKIPEYKITDTLVKLNILRIVPYCEDNEVELWLMDTLKRL